MKDCATERSSMSSFIVSLPILAPLRRAVNSFGDAPSQFYIVLALRVLLARHGGGPAVALDVA